MKTEHISFDIFNPFPHLICGFSTRKGGKSEGEFKSLNLGLHTGDDQAIVKQNREAFFSNLNIPVINIAFTDQVHSSKVEIVRGPEIYPQTDGLITAEKNLYLVIQTADCFPVFMYDPLAEVVAAVHCGWRSVFSGILENTLTLMREHFQVNPQNIMAAVGPGLQKECFEVRADLYEQVDPRYLRAHPEPDRRLFDLRSLVVDKLQKQGVRLNNIFLADHCTKCEDDLFYSFRRDGLRSGRMIGVIGIQDPV